MLQNATAAFTQSDRTATPHFFTISCYHHGSLPLERACEALHAASNVERERLLVRISAQLKHSMRHLASTEPPRILICIF